MGIYGQDWSSYQSATPDTSGLAFAFVKVTEGTGYVNPLWVRQRDHAKAAGLLWGAYHYPHMGNDPHTEADYFLAQVNWQPGDIVVLDWEGYDDANSSVSHSTQLAYKEAWLRYAKNKLPHNRVGMYANDDYWRNIDTTGYYADFLWIATAGRAAGDPGIQADWLFHQYSDSGVDHDYCHLSSLADLKAWALIQEADMPLTHSDAQTVWGYSNGDKPDVHQTLADAAAQSTAAAAGVKALTAQLGATNAAIAALTTALQSSGGITAEQVQAAAQAGAAAALAELGHALDGTKP
ncbi:glycoside hydrolase family 25 protein [Streptomyces sp. NPDC001404]|uniref:glycoside hydrolase family 25 protein n=1 Tax=Streptomyces sp. NPDC001404 TaxID=3364571 RepID=UPI00369F5F27